MKVLCLLLVLFAGLACTVSDEEKMKCLDQYIRKTSALPVYSQIRQGVVDSINSWKAKKLDVRFCVPECEVLDSAVFFNRDYSRCIFLMIERSPAGEQQKFNFVQTIGGERIDGRWHYYHVSFPGLAYSLKSNGYKDLSIEYLSKDARLDIINRGFFKEGTCKIDPDFVDSEEWFAGWIRVKHDLFLNGRGADNR